MLIVNLDQIAKSLESHGAQLCDWSRATQDPEPELVIRLTAEISRLVAQLKKFPSTRGKHFLKSACDAAICTVEALGRIPEILPRSNLQLIESYQWNQTRRLKDLAADPVEHLQAFWERWYAQVNDAADEIKKIATCDPDDDSEDSVEFSDEEEIWMRDMLRKITDAELAMAKECHVLTKQVRGLMRKVRVKCINHLGYDSIQEVQFADELFSIGDTLVAEADNLATAVFPTQDSLCIREMAIRLAEAGQKLADLARMHTADEATQQWFENSYRQFDILLIPVIERSPLR